MYITTGDVVKNVTDLLDSKTAVPLFKDQEEKLAAGLTVCAFACARAPCVCVCAGARWGRVRVVHAAREHTLLVHACGSLLRPRARRTQGQQLNSLNRRRPFIWRPTTVPCLALPRPALPYLALPCSQELNETLGPRLGSVSDPRPCMPLQHASARPFQPAWEHPTKGWRLSCSGFAVCMTSCCVSGAKTSVGPGVGD